MIAVERKIRFTVDETVDELLKNTVSKSSIKPNTELKEIIIP